MYFLQKHLKPGSFKNLYCDTDSCCLATTKSLPLVENMSIEQQRRAIFDPIIKPEMRDSWEMHWKSWFVVTDSVEDERFPGKLKFEFGFTRGQFVALAPKTYMAYNADKSCDESVKLGTKGIPHSEQIDIEAFIDKLYAHGDHTVKLRSLRLDQNRVMSRIEQVKKGLTDIFVKFPVDEDMITCRPLKHDSKYL